MFFDNLFEKLHTRKLSSWYICIALENDLSAITYLTLSLHATCHVIDHLLFVTLLIIYSLGQFW